MTIDVEATDPELAPGVAGGRFDAVRVGFIAAMLIVVVLAGIVGWQWVHVRDVHQTEQQRALFLGAARQGAVNLTTIGYSTIDADVQRILDSSTGSIREDFEKRSRPFIEVVKRARSTSEGTITDAGLESVDGDSAKALVAVKVKTSVADATEPEPRYWRMRIMVQRTESGVKMSNVEFVP